MLNTYLDITQEVLVRQGVSTTTTSSGGLYTDTILGSWATSASRWATAYHKWPFTEGRLGTTFTSGGGPGADEWYFEGVKADSTRLAQIGGFRLKKLNFEDYQIMREAQPYVTDRVFSDFGRTIFINPHIDVTGTLYVYSQFQPAAWDITDNTTITIFSNYDEEGNDAIVNKMISYAKTREGKIEEAGYFDKLASQKLDEIWKRVEDEQALYQTSDQRGGMFERFDVLWGRRTSDEIKENQF